MVFSVPESLVSPDTWMEESAKMNSVVGTSLSTWLGAYNCQPLAPSVENTSSYVLFSIFLLVTFQSKTEVVSCACKTMELVSRKNKKQLLTSDLILLY